MLARKKRKVPAASGALKNKEQTVQNSLLFFFVCNFVCDFNAEMRRKTQKPRDFMKA